MSPAPSSARPAWSITLRLTFLYALSAFVLLAGAAAFLHWVLQSRLAAEDTQLLADKVRILRLLLQEHGPAPAAFEEELQVEGAARQFNKYYARLLDAQGQTLLETPGMTEIMPARVFPNPVSVGQEPTLGQRWRPNHRQTCLLVAARGASGKALEGECQIQVGLEVSQENALLTAYRRSLLLVLGLGTLLSTLAGALVARHGMRPLADITQAAQRVTASQLSQRIASAGWPKELSALATAFDDMLQRLEESFARLSRFSADLAHELRTPLNNLMGEAEVALAKTRTPEEYRQVLESSLEEYGRLARMTEALLFLARAENAENRIEKVQLSARREIEAVAQFHEAVATEQGTALRCQGEAVVSADPMFVRRAVSNLLSNALKFTPRGGQITVSVRPAPGQAVHVAVQDTGCGIAPEHLPRVFDRFYRVDPARADSSSGTGLGLAIVRSIMDLHGGRAAIESQPGRGTTVTLEFPGLLSQGAPPDSPPPTAHRTAGQPRQASVP